MAGDKNISQLGAKANEFHPNDLVIIRDFQTNRDVKVTYAQLLVALGSGNGLSAYQVAVAEGYVGTVTEWLESLNGESAYEIAVANGFVGTEAEWLASLEGTDGQSAYEIAVANGFVGTEAEWLESLEGQDGASAYEIAVANGFMGTEAEWLESLNGAPGGVEGFPEADDKVYGIKNQEPYEIVDAPVGRRVEEVELIVNNTTSGDLLIARWYNDANVFREILALPLTFIGAPSAGNFRWDLGFGNADGSYSQGNGTEGAEALKPDTPAGAVVLYEILWNSAGEAVTNPNPGGGGGTASVFPTARYATAVSADTTGKYAKIMEINLSKAQDYSFTLDYGSPGTLEKNKAGRVHVAFVCTDAKIIHGITVTIQTVGFSEAGDFVLVQLSGNKAALYHKSTNYWMRLQWRVTFMNSAMKASDFLNNGVYGTLAAGTNWQSEVYGGGSGSSEATIRENNTVLFDKDYIIGNAAARSGNILFDFTGAKLGAKTLMKHADASAFTMPAQSKKLFDSTIISTTATNYFEFKLVDKTPGSEVVEVKYWFETGAKVSPYKLAQEGATDGQALVWSAANQRFQPGSVSGGGSNWTLTGSDIYRNSKVAIGRTSVSGYTFTVRQTASDPIALYENASGQMVFEVQSTFLQATREFVVDRGSGNNQAMRLKANGEVLRVQNNTSGTILTVQQAFSQFNHEVVVTPTGITSIQAFRIRTISNVTVAAIVQNDAGSNTLVIRKEGDLVSFGRIIAGGSAFATNFRPDAMLQAIGDGTATELLRLEASGRTTRHRFFDNGNVDFYALPTSDPGVAGRLWRSGADVKISI